MDVLSTQQAQFILVLFWFLVLVQSIDINFDDCRDGFFLKSPYHKFKPSEPSVVKESLILTQLAEVYKLRASYGPFELHKAVPNQLVDNALSYGDPLDTFEVGVSRQLVHNMDITAHLMKRQIPQSNPSVHVLIHTQPLTQRQHLIYNYYRYSQSWCAQIFVTNGIEEFTAVCLLSDETGACLADLQLPESWWSNSSFLNQKIPVHYDIVHVEQNQECASVSNSIITTHRAAETGKPTSQRKFISNLELIHERKIYTEQREKELIFKIPNFELNSYSEFEVPVLVDKKSSLKEFVIKVKVRGPLVVESASTTIDSQWSVFFEPGEKEGTATVTAFLKEDAESIQSASTVEIMRWQFRVAKDHKGLAMGSASVLWTIDKLSGSAYFSGGGNKISAKFNIHKSQTETLIPVLKERNLLNTAVLTGKLESYDLLVFSVMNDNTLHKLSKNISCRSMDAEVLKVSAGCEFVYFDGSETHGAKNVTILVRTMNQMAYLGVRVWVPEPRLDIQFSDSKLSHIRGWKVKSSSSKSRMKRSFDLGLLTHPSVLVGVDDLKTPTHQSCSYKYQQSLVDVYARFVISAPGEAPHFYRNKKTYVRVTDLIKDRLQTANPDVARIIDYTVQGISPGKTDVQVVSPTGKLLGTKEIKVGRDKVDIERLMVRVVTGLGLNIEEDRHVPGNLLATVYLKDHFFERLQEAVLDIALEFKDGTTLPLSKIDKSQYSLEVTSVSPGVVQVVKTKSGDSSSIPPTIQAIGVGKGDIIKIVLKEMSGCHRRKDRILDTEYVHVLVNFAKGGYFGQAQRDANVYDNQASQGHYEDVSFSNKKEYFKHTHGKSHQQLFKKHNENTKQDKFAHKVYNLNDYKNAGHIFTDSNVKYNTNTAEPKQSDGIGKPVNTNAVGPTPLEIGMYVLVAVFLFALFVFMCNCAVFMVRYRRKRRGNSKKSSRVVKGSISQAPDWVWIGRDTLERNGARQTSCNQPLMADEDFNGNQMMIPNSVTSSSSVYKNRLSTASEDSSSSGIPKSSSNSHVPVTSNASNRNSMSSTYEGSECSIRITSNPLPDNDSNDSGMGYNEAEWDYEAMGMTYEQLMDYFDNLKESCA